MTDRSETGPDRWPAAAALALVVGLCGTGCEEPTEIPPPEGVLLIVVDALRPDHLGLYGYRRDTSPTLDRLAADGMVFESAFSPAGWTRPSIASLFTSLQPTVHGLGRRARRTQHDLYLSRLDHRHLTLAERLSSAGYATLGIAGNPHLQRHQGFAQGFDQYFQAERDARQVWETFEVWWRSRRPARFFAYLHFMDVHWPYTPPAPYDRRFADPEAVDPFRGIDWQELRETIRSGTRPVTAADLEALVARYDGAIRYFDDRLGEFLDRWEGPAEDLLIVVTADHGEEFLDHGRIGHGPFLYEVNLHIPLLVRLPGGRDGGRRIDRQVDLLDLHPTLLDLAGTQVPKGLQGRSLVDAWRAPERFLDRDLFAEERWKDFSRRTAIRSGTFKLIRTEIFRSDPGTVPGVFLELFDLVADPGEQHNLASQQPDRAAALLRRIEAYQARADGVAAPATTVPIDPETEERLRSLGYID